MFKLANKWENRTLRYIRLQCVPSVSTAEKSLTFSLSSMNCSRLSGRVILSEERDPPPRSFPVLRRTRDWSPLTFYHFLLINWVQESHLLWESLWRALLHRQSMTPWSIDSVCQLWVNSNSFVCYHREYSCKSLCWRVVNLKHSSQGHSHPHPGNISHRLPDGRPLVMQTWCVAVWHLLDLLGSCVHMSSVAASTGGARRVNLKVHVITISWQISAEVNGSLHLNEWVLWRVFGQIVCCWCWSVGGWHRFCHMKRHQGVSSQWGVFYPAE